MPRLEDVLADLAGVPGARAAALAGLDGLLVDEVRAPGAAAVDLDGAVVELTHAWNALRRASDEHLGGDAARELLLFGPRGATLARMVGDGWFALLWAAPDVDVADARAALERAAAGFAEVVA